MDDLLLISIGVLCVAGIIWLLGGIKCRTIPKKKEILTKEKKEGKKY